MGRKGQIQDMFGSQSPTEPSKIHKHIAVYGGVNYLLLNTYYVQGTVLSISHALS